MKEKTKAFLRHLPAMVKANFEKDGSLLSVAFVEIVRDLQSGEMLPEPTIAVLPAVFTNRASKDRFAKMIAEVVELGGSQMVALANETWIGTSPEAERYHDEHGTLVGAPGVEEALIIQIEFPEKYESQMAYITRDPAGRPRVGPWKKHSGPKSSITGRLAGFIKKRIVS